MNRGKELAKNTLILSIGTFLPKFVALITIPIITGHLTKVDYGTYDLLTTLVSLLLPVISLQIHSAAFRFLIDCRNDPIEKKKIITNIYSFLVPTSVITLIILSFFLSNIDWLTRALIILYFLVDIIIVATQQVVRGLANNKLYSASAVTQSFCNMVLIVITVLLTNQGLNGVLLSFIVATFVALLLLLIRGGIIKEIDINVISVKTLKQMLSYSWPMIPNTLSNWVLSASDRLVLTAFMGLEAVAVYGAANKIPLLFTSVQGTFIFAWQENASLALADNDVSHYYSKMYDKIMSLLSGVMAILIGATPIVFRLLIKGDYSDAYPQLPILFMGVFFSAIASFLGGIYVAHKRTKNVGITTMLAAICNLIIDLTLVHSIGIYAASISTLISYLLLMIYRMIDIKKFQKISYNYLKIIGCVTVLFGMCVLCYINSAWSNIINFVIGISFAVIINLKVLKSLIHVIFIRMNKK